MKAVVRFTLIALTVVLAAVPFAITPGLTIDYPVEGALFPPDIASPTLLWRDTSRATAWRIEISFASGAPPLRLTSSGPRLRLGDIDQDCISTTNALPKADPQQRAWKPNAAAWELIKRQSKTAPATITLTGLGEGRAVSKAAVHIQTSGDPVGAPIFYRDVPLMPTETEKGAIKPLAPYAVRLVEWRLRKVNETQSRIVMQGLPMCANCHSFSRDGKFMGMDLDGLQNNRGRYFLAEVKPEVTVRAEDVIQWTSAQARLENPVRVGFMSQISPSGDAVVTTIDTPGNGSSNYYVANFTDYRFLQVFFPTRGVLAWYSRNTGILQSLPGADDPAYVQFGAVWSPDGDYLVFARARAQDPNPPGLPLARFANDANELQIRYDLYRIPFRNGRGGRAEPIPGAADNGLSNSFPKVSPDGRWLVFVQSRNGQLMRPDSQLFIVPTAGGQARRMRCNTPLMNSWHSFSPNGRWLVFSSKARSPYTQMYLTHIDADGNDTPPILIEDATAANRAVNLPEFINVPADGLRAIGGPALDYYRLYDRALYLQKEERYNESAAAWKALLEIAPEDTDARRRLGMTLLLAGRRSEALPHLEKAEEDSLQKTPLALAIRLMETGRDAEPVAISGNPTAQEHYYLALAGLRRAEKEAAIAHLRQAVALNPDYAEAHQKLAETAGQPSEALEHWRETIRLRPNNATALRRAAWILATNQTLRNGPEALAMAVQALLLTNSKDSATLDTLAAAYAENNRFEDAIATARRAIAADPAQAQAIQRRIERYQAGKPWRE
jgi:tetratricopeptide (TPR) repeat protein